MFKISQLSVIMRSVTNFECNRFEIMVPKNELSPWKGVVSGTTDSAVPGAVDGVVIVAKQLLRWNEQVQGPRNLGGSKKSSLGFKYQGFLTFSESRWKIY